ncbi:glutathione-disulfide reductase [Legionella gresilensis]|uniref:glutathione-disulfide reductase n=1 Tax=Legionella gresilensis TaxID=91823 RepID=UPI001041323A|nr:glutathione-disulfide reductase [Legionella gresilensis]
MDFDLIVLGGGSGGIASAVRAAKYGAKVAVVEKSHLGGTCVNLGCVPKKIMFNASLIAEHLHKASDYGFTPVDVNLDWPTLVNKREAYIARLREIYASRFSQYNITHLRGEGFFVDKQTISVADKQYKAPHIIIATGGEPTMPNDLEGNEHLLTSDGFFHLTKKPKSVAIIGSGYIGVELAGVLHGLGVKTHLLIRGNRPLSRFDSMLGDTLLEIMKLQGLDVHLNHCAKAITLQPDGKKNILCTKGSLISNIDVVIAAVGRTPRTFNLNLDKVGVLQDQQGLIVVDKYQNTNIPGIYALGDVINEPALTPVAIAAGRRLCDRLFGGQKEAHLDYENICSVVFTHPPIGSVGYSEDEALTKFGAEKLKIYKTRFNPMFDALSDQKLPTAMKLITLGPDEKIIGLHVIGYGADEMLQGFGVAVKMGACKRDFDNTVAIHPTSAEEFVTLI